MHSMKNFFYNKNGTFLYFIDLRENALDGPLIIRSLVRPQYGPPRKSRGVVFSFDFPLNNFISRKNRECFLALDNFREVVAGRSQRTSTLDGEEGSLSEFFYFIKCGGLLFSTGQFYLFGRFRSKGLAVRVNVVGLEGKGDDIQIFVVL